MRWKQLYLSSGFPRIQRGLLLGGPKRASSQHPTVVLELMGEAEESQSTKDRAIHENSSLETVLARCRLKLFFKPWGKKKKKLEKLFSKPCKVMLFSARGSFTMQHLLEVAKFQRHWRRERHSFNGNYLLSIINSLLFSNSYFLLMPQPCYTHLFACRIALSR